MRMGRLFILKSSKQIYLRQKTISYYKFHSHLEKAIEKVIEKRGSQPTEASQD